MMRVKPGMNRIAILHQPNNYYFISSLDLMADELATLVVFYEICAMSCSHQIRIAEINNLLSA